MRNTENCANILLLGKTGVGKSAFINYFLNENIASSDTGAPVTKEKFSQPYRCDTGKFPIMIYDTKGVEALSADEQIAEITKEIEKRNGSDDVRDWFHTIFYCVSMGTARFEPYESELIKKLSSTISQHIHIIITHCDACTEQMVAEMENEIKSKIGDSENVKIFPVVSVETKKRNGTVTHRRGKEAIEDSVFELLWKDICAKVSEEYALEAHKEIVLLINSEFDEGKKIIADAITFGNFIKSIKDDISELDEQFDSRMDELESHIADKVKVINKKYNDILLSAKQMYESYKSVAIDDYAQFSGLDMESLDFEKCGEILDYFSDDRLNDLAPSITQLDSDEFNLGIFLGAIGDLIFLKSRVMRYIDDVKQKVLAKIPSITEIQKGAYDKLIQSAI